MTTPTVRQENPRNTINRQGFGLREQIKPQLSQDYHSDLVERIRQNGYRLSCGRLTFVLAQEFGFCYGVDRAVDLAYETRQQFPDKRIFLTNEIIHNPRVNQRLVELGIHFMKGPYADPGEPPMTAQDIVILPAFGTTTQELERLQSAGCVLVDSTCGSVVHVWKRVEKYAHDGFTSVIHGKYNHEETMATSSRAGKYVIVRDKAQAQVVCDYMLGRASRPAWDREFSSCTSPGLDPDRDLEKIGVANQTTMLSSESLEIAAMVQRAMEEKFGAQPSSEHFRSFDTICSATQERQDAIIQLARDPAIDLILVIGGYNSSNTGHLAEIASQSKPTYHIADTSCLVTARQIRHRTPHDGEIRTSTDWLADRQTIGLTAGASTPNRVVGEVVQRVCELAGVDVKAEAS